jgi:hypothetical protein
MTDRRSAFFAGRLARLQEELGRIGADGLLFQQRVG